MGGANFRSFFILGFLILTTEAYAAPQCNLLVESLEKARTEFRLIGQESSSLLDADLVRVDGGLCGPTCLYNLAVALNDEFNVDISNLNNPPAFVRDVGNIFSWKDVRIGTSQKDMVYALRFKLDPDSQKISVGISSVDSKWLNVSPNDLVSPTRAIMIAIGWRTGGHWVVVKKVDLERQLIYVSDPLYPYDEDRALRIWSDYVPGLGNVTATNYHGSAEKTLIGDILYLEMFDRKNSSPLVTPFDVALRREELFRKHVRIYSSEGSMIEGKITKIFDHSDADYNLGVEITFGHSRMILSAGQMEMIEILDNQKNPKLASPPKLQLRPAIPKARRPKQTLWPRPTPRPRPQIPLTAISSKSDLAKLVGNQISLMRKDGLKMEGSILRIDPNSPAGNPSFTFVFKERGSQVSFRLNEIAGLIK